MIDVLLPERTTSSYINSVGSNKPPRQERFSGFTQNRLEQNREKCKEGMYPKNMWWQEE